MPTRLLRLIALLAFSFVFTACVKPAATTANMLTEAEKAEGWRLLFDGQTLNGWRGFHQQTVPAAWRVEDHTLAKIPMGKNAEGKVIEGPDLITTDQYGDFELQLEWKISPGGNSGIKYLVSEDLSKEGGHAVSFEMQVIDDDNHPDATKGINGNRAAGALYDLLPATHKTLRPVGEYNQVRLIKKGPHIEHWLNGVKVLEFDQGSPELKAAIAQSKFKDKPGFGEAQKGYILLQDHGDAVWYRNLKIRELK